MNDLIEWLSQKSLDVLGFVIKAAIAIVVFYVISRVLDMLLNAVRKKLDAKGVDRTATGFVINLIKYSILIFVIVTIVIQLKIAEVASITALIASAGVGISLAMQGALSNFAGGILILMLRPFRIGDYIIVASQNVEGSVENIEMYYTTVRTSNNEIIKVPNSSLTNNAVINKMPSEEKLLFLKFNVHYDTDIGKAKEILLGILMEDGRITGDNRRVFVDELSDSSVVMGMLGTVRNSEYNSIRRDICEKVLLEFRANGIKIPFNQLDVHIVEASDR